MKIRDFGRVNIVFFLGVVIEIHFKTFFFFIFKITETSSSCFIVFEIMKLMLLLLPIQILLVKQRVKSTTGFIVKINDNTVFCNSKKQSVVAIFSSEAEYVSLSSCFTKYFIVGNLLNDLIDNVFPITTFEDN